MKKILPVHLAGTLPLATEIFEGLAKAGAPHAAIFGGAPRDALYEAYHHVTRPIKDYDIRIWTRDDYKATETALVHALNQQFGPNTIELAAGTGRPRYMFNFHGAKLDVSIRPAPDCWKNKNIPLAAVAIERAGDSDVGISSVALDPKQNIWATQDFLADFYQKTLTVYCGPDQDRLKAYSERMQAKFPNHRLLWQR